MVKESTIRLITRLADQHNAINLAQGFTDEAAIFEMVWGNITASLGGNEDGINRLDNITLKEIARDLETDTGKFLETKLKDVLQ